MFLVAALISFMLRRDVDMDPYEEKYGEMQDSVDVFVKGNLMQNIRYDYMTYCLNCDTLSQTDDVHSFNH